MAMARHLDTIVTQAGIEIITGVITIMNTGIIAIGIEPPG